MELSDLVAGEGQAKFARRMGVDKSYLNHILADRKKLSRPLAIKIYRETGHKLGPIVGLPDTDIEVLERLG